MSLCRQHYKQYYVIVVGTASYRVSTRLKILLDKKTWPEKTISVFDNLAAAEVLQQRIKVDLVTYLEEMTVKHSGERYKVCVDKEERWGQSDVI